MKHSRAVLASAVVLALMVVALFPFVPVHAISITLGTQVAVPATPTGSVAVLGGVAFYNNLEFTTSYYYGTVFSINTGGSTYSNLTAHTTGVLNRVFYGLAVDSVSGNLAATRRIVGNDGTKDGVSVISTSTGTITDVLDGSNGSPNYQNEFDQIGYYNGNFYTAAGGVLFKIQSTSPYTVTQYNTGLGPGNTGYFGFKADGSSNVWFTEILSGKLCKFDGSTVTCYSGFSRPIDLAISGQTAYVTENNANGKIDTVALGTGAISSQTSTTGTPMGIGIFGGNVVWADNGVAGNICILSGACTATGEHPAFMTSDGLGKIIYSYIGSNGVGEASLSTQTLTTTITSLVGHSCDDVNRQCVLTYVAAASGSSSSTSSSSSSSSGGAVSASVKGGAYNNGIGHTVAPPSFGANSGDLLIAAVLYTDPSSSPSATDSQGNSWTLDSVALAGPPGQQAALLHTTAKSGSDSVTIDCGGTSNRPCTVMVLEVSGAGMTITTSTGSGTSQTSGSTGSVTFGSAAFIIAAMSIYNPNNAVLTCGSGFTCLSASSPGNAMMAIEYSTGATSPTTFPFTTSAAMGNWAEAGAAYSK